jgi:osmotically inducible lipoprotein OsmB
MKAMLVLSCLAGLLALAACGESKATRAATGAVGGAVVGTAVGAPIEGAAAGGVYGVATDDD